MSTLSRFKRSTPLGYGTWEVSNSSVLTSFGGLLLRASRHEINARLDCNPWLDEAVCQQFLGQQLAQGGMSMCRRQECPWHKIFRGGSIPTIDESDSIVCRDGASHPIQCPIARDDLGDGICFTEICIKVRRRRAIDHGHRSRYFRGLAVLRPPGRHQIPQSSAWGIAAAAGSVFVRES